jgi:hypothetical protein
MYHTRFLENQANPESPDEPPGNYDPPPFASGSGICLVKVNLLNTNILPNTDTALLVQM